MRPFRRQGRASPGAPPDAMEQGTHPECDMGTENPQQPNQPGKPLQPDSGVPSKPTKNLKAQGGVPGKPRK